MISKEVIVTKLFELATSAMVSSAQAHIAFLRGVLHECAERKMSTAETLVHMGAAIDKLEELTQERAVKFAEQKATLL